ncbi:hypothetical protein CNR22_15425 [Sphingobacteriaceae bacterium]|nr:hypothetical protein CNR22_15425 [Sphingobacteriaceae bacterium]
MRTLLESNPKTFLLIDSVGALLTTIGLVVIRFFFEAWFRMPWYMLLVLAAIAFTFFIYSFCSFYFVKTNHAVFLGRISRANYAYCFLTVCLLIKYRLTLTIFDWFYFVSEVLIILALVLLEARSIKREQSEPTKHSSPKTQKID